MVNIGGQSVNRSADFVGQSGLLRMLTKASPDVPYGWHYLGKQAEKIGPAGSKIRSNVLQRSKEDDAVTEI